MLAASTADCSCATAEALTCDDRVRACHPRRTTAARHARPRPRGRRISSTRKEQRSSPELLRGRPSRPHRAAPPCRSQASQVRSVLDADGSDGDPRRGKHPRERRPRDPGAASRRTPEHAPIGRPRSIGVKPDLRRPSSVEAGSIQERSWLVSGRRASSRPAIESARPGVTVGPTTEFSLFFRVKHGEGAQLRQGLLEALQGHPGYRPGEYNMAITTIRRTGFVLFDDDTRLLFATSFDSGRPGRLYGRLLHVRSDAQAVRCDLLARSTGTTAYLTWTRSRTSSSSAQVTAAAPRAQLRRDREGESQSAACGSMRSKRCWIVRTLRKRT